MKKPNCYVAAALLCIGVATVSQAQSPFDDSSMRKETAQRIATTHGIRLDWQRNTLMQLMDSEARLDTVKRIKQNHGVEFDWRESTVMQLMDAETRMDAASRTSRATGEFLDWRKYSLMQLMEVELRASGVDVEAVKKAAASKAQQHKGGVAACPVYITKVDEDKDDVLLLTNGGIVKITLEFLGFVGFRKDAVLFKDGSRWKIWIEAKKVLQVRHPQSPVRSCIGKRRDRLHFGSQGGWENTDDVGWLDLRG